MTIVPMQIALTSAGGYYVMQLSALWGLSIPNKLPLYLFEFACQAHTT